MALAAGIPVLVSLLAYILVISRVARYQLGVPRFPILFKMFKKSVVSLMYDLRVLTIGLRKWSTKWNIFSVGDPLAEMIGLPGVFSLFFVNLGDKYNCGVLQQLSDK